MMYESIYSAEDEVDRWREQINKDIRGMSPHEITEYYRRKTEPVMREFHLKTGTPLTANTAGKWV